MKILLLTAFIFLSSLQLSAQTSQEEYNYVTKGYKIQLESGLDMKKGYELKDVDEVKQSATNGSIARECYLKALYRVSSTGSKVIVAYMIIYQRTGKEKEYLCVPMPSSSNEIRDAYFISLNPDSYNNSERLQVIAFLLSRSLKW